MIAVILILFILSLFAIFIFNKPIGLIYLLIVLLAFSQLITDKIAPELLPYTETLINLLLLAGLVVYVVVYNKSSLLINHPYFLLSVFVCIYLLGLAFLRGLPFTTYFNYYRGEYIGSLVFLLALLMNKNFDQKTFHRFLLLMFSFQVFLGIIQYIGPEDLNQFLISRHEVQIGEKTVPVVASTQLDAGGRLATGTLGRFNHYGNFLAMIIIYFLSSILISRSLIEYKTLYWVLILFGLYALILSGNKASLLSIIVGIVLILWFKNRKLFWKLAFISCCILYFIVPFLINISETNKEDLYSSDNPFLRMTNIFALFDLSSLDIQEINWNNMSTITITLYCIPLFLDHFLFGSNLVGTNEFINITSKLSTDATLVIILAEFGIVGTLIILSTFIYVLRLIKKKCPKEVFYVNVIIFTVLLIQTITDPGLLSRLCNFIYFFISAMQIKTAIIADKHPVLLKE